jgi:sensor histidine kinase YesM
MSAQTAFAWYKVLLLGLFFFGLWALLSPLIFRIAKRFPMARKKWAQRLGLHLLFAAAFGMSLRMTHELMRLLLLAPGEPILFKMIFPDILRALVIDMALYFAILAAGHAVEYFRKLQNAQVRAARLQAHLTQAEVHALKMQLHPHFLFNTYHAIVGLMVRQENEKAILMLRQLSALLRLTLAHAGVQEIALQKELELVELYLGIQQIRFSDRLIVQKNIAPDTLAAQVPALILQPLVENCIRHGIAPYSPAGLIEIHARRSNGTLQLQVRDNGPGLPPNGGAKIQEGVGLKNTRRRLQQLYGEAQHFELRNDARGGLRLTIALPFHENWSMNE